MRDLNRWLAKYETIRPSGKPPYTTLGIAIDYRVRYYFCITPAQELVAWDGALRGTNGEPPISIGPKQAPIPAREPVDPLDWTLVQDFFSSLEEKLTLLSPNERVLDQCEEEELNRYCFVLALFEVIFRAGMHSTSPLFSNGPIATVDELLAIPEPDWVDDMCKMSRLFKERSGDLLLGKVILNPTFDGSGGVGGADADLIVDGCLIDMKAIVKPSMGRQKLYQLLGYVLLDYSDQYRLKSAGFYFLRQGVIAKWPLNDLLGLLSEGKALPLEELRERFRQLVKEELWKRFDQLVKAEGNPI